MKLTRSPRSVQPNQASACHGGALPRTPDRPLRRRGGYTPSCSSIFAASASSTPPISTIARCRLRRHPDVPSPEN